MKLKIGILSCMTIYMIGYAEQNNQLTLIENHTVTGQKQLELGTIVMYFNRKPAVEPTKKQIKQEEAYHFFLPGVTVTSQKIKNDIEKINKITGLYAFAVREVDQPKKGLLVTINFDPSKIGFKLDQTESIGLQGALIFHFYNNELLKKIENIGNPIVQTACRSVVIDCGHGGNDVGAMGCNNVLEKNVCLPVGLAVADILKKEGISTHLSRDSDMTMCLGERTSYANSCKADLFVSIHANSAKNKAVSGIETYYIQPDLFFCLSESDIKFCSYLTGKYRKSKKLAYCVHNSLINTIQKNYDIKDRFIRSAVSNVLVGTAMPSILVEIGYVSHEHESRLLSQSAYQKQVAHGIARGILEYLRQTSKLA